MSVAVIVVNYGTADLAIQSVDSVLERTHGGRKVEVHLVDNASPGGDAERFRAAAEGWGDRVTLWLEETNHGFGRGNNLVIKELAAHAQPPDYVFLLNPDAWLDNEAVDILAGHLDANPKVGAVGASVANPDSGPAVACFRFPGIAHETANAMKFGPYSKLMKNRLAPFPPDRPTGPVDWVTGAAVMFRLSAVQDAGFFDPVFFLYYEEVDLMHRLTQAGWAIHYVLEARVMHDEGSSTQVQSRATDRRRRPPYVYRSWRHYYSKTHGRGQALWAALCIYVAGAVGLVLAKLRRRSVVLPLHFFRDHWKYTIAPLAGLGRDAEYDADVARYAALRPVCAVEPEQAMDQTPDHMPVRGSVNCNPPGIGFWALIAEDLRTHDSDFFAQGFWALFWHRFGNWRMSLKPRILRGPFSLIYKAMHKVTQWVCGIDLPYSMPIGRRVKLEHFGGMILVADRIGDDVTVRQNTTFGIAGLHAPFGRPKIGDRVEIGVGAVLVGNIEIGAGAIIGANAVVVKDVAPGTVVGGVPARELGQPLLAVTEEDRRHG